MTAKEYMPARIVAVVLLFTCFMPAQQAEEKKEEKPAFQLETFYMAIMSRAHAYDADKLAALSKDRQQFWQSIAERGDLIVGGPVIVVKDALADVEVFRAADQKSAEDLAQRDPAVQHKLWTVLVLPWGTQKDFLKPVKRYDPSVSYYLGFLKRGASWSPEDTPERQRIQEAHLKNIGHLHEIGKLVAAGPFMEDTDWRGIFVFKAASIEEANELTNTDPAVQAGRLRIDLYEWKLPSEAFGEGK
jgi:uncharacterized protein YciI